MDGIRVALTVEQLSQAVPGGSGTYVTELTRSMCELGEVSLVGLAARAVGPTVTSLGIPIVRSRLPRRVLYQSWDRLRRPRADALVRDVDVVHATTWAVPGSRRPLVVTVHDLAFLRAPEQFTRHGDAFFRRAFAITRAEAAAVLVPSLATRDDCVAHGIEPARITVVPHGVRVPDVRAEDSERFRSSRGIVRPYVLWCGTVEPRKNVARLVDAFARVAADVALDLVLAGPPGWGSAEEDLGRAAAQVPPGRLHQVGHLEWSELHAAYAGARAFAFPSLWEGFGLPVLEAMAHGVPVLTTQGSSMAEFLGEGGVLVDPLDVDAIAAGLLRVVGHERDGMADRARAAAQERTWQAAAEATVEVYRAVLSSSGRSAS